MPGKEGTKRGSWVRGGGNVVKNPSEMDKCRLYLPPRGREGEKPEEGRSAEEIPSEKPQNPEKNPATLFDRGRGGGARHSGGAESH